MSVRSFHSVFMVGGVAAAALSCYLVSLRVASERAALESVETEIVLAQRDIRVLQTEIGTRGRLAQLERWNVRVLALSAPSADQFVPDSFQLARLVAPERKPAVEAPVVYASAPPAPAPGVLPPSRDQASPSVPGRTLLHEASLKVPAATAKPKPPTQPKPTPVKLASADPLAPLPAAKKKAPASKPSTTATDDTAKAATAKTTTTKDSGKTR